MTIDYWLRTATQSLETKAIKTARLDCLVLLEDTLHLNRAQLLAEPSTEMTEAQVHQLKKLLNRRAQHEPLAYIRGHSEFYGREFVISPAVLEPRPESETMIDLFKDLVADGKLPQTGHTSITLADVGAGSGALGITASLEVPECQVELLEIDPKATEIAKINVDKLTTHIMVRQSDLLASSGQTNQVLLCNLPYVPDDASINQAATHEPKLALFGGPDGLNVYRKLFKQVSGLPIRPLFILSEAFPNQHQALTALALAADYKLLQKNDFIQVFGCIQN